jgi:hypothetical protein
MVFLCSVLCLITTFVYTQVILPLSLFVSLSRVVELVMPVEGGKGGQEGGIRFLRVRRDESGAFLLTDKKLQGDWEHGIRFLKS